MKLLSWNIRGLGQAVKRRAIKEEILKANPDVVLLQETKLEAVDSFLIRSIWESGFKDWRSLPSVGAAGGVLIIWDIRRLKFLDVLPGTYTLSVCFETPGHGNWWFSSVYGPVTPRLRSELWEELSAVFGLCSPNWCIGGDFNVVRFPCETLQQTRMTSSMRRFDSFIRECGLVDFPLSNGQFTWSVTGRRVASRIDRFLATTAWADLFPSISQQVSVRTTSDHFPIILDSNPLPWGPTPFRFENMWTTHPSFASVSQEAWEGCTVPGWEGFKFMRKLKAVKGALKVWNRQVFGDTRIRKEALRAELEDLDKCDLDQGLSDLQIQRRSSCLQELEEVAFLEERSWRQKMKFRWPKEGDCNTKLFHRVAAGRRRKATIKEIEDDSGVLHRDSFGISESITSFFESLLTEEDPSRPMIDGLHWQPISESSAVWLERPFEVTEVKKVVFSLDRDKAPGPDGFSIGFFQDQWDLIEKDLMLVLVEFFNNGIVGKSMNATFISLIPKKNRSVKVRDFRPISLISSVYKIISKLLATRLATIIDSTIAPSQSAFVGGRQILDSVLVANEVVDDVRRRGGSGVALKLDFEKAYDRVSWSFLDKVMERKGFGSRWRSWISGCLKSVSFSVLVNGSAQRWFSSSRGLRQGCPLSPFLFSLAADVLSRMVDAGAEAGLIRGLLVGRDGVRVPLLQFADDTLFLLEADRRSLLNILVVLQLFNKVSGLKVNLLKSGLAPINLPDSQIASLRDLVGCDVLNWPISYLGLPLGGNPRKASFWDPVITKVTKRLDAWKGVYFSLGGRITLIQAALSSLPLYFLSLFRIPVSVANSIECIMRNFLWHGTGEKKDHLVSWEAVCRPREKGGLGLGNLVLKNRSLIGKWFWRFPLESESLWHQVVKSRYGLHANGWDVRTSTTATHSSPWKFISQVSTSLLPLIHYRVGDGARVNFWEDVWIGGSSLKSTFPRLFRVSRLQNSPVSSFFSIVEGSVSWNFHFFRDLNDLEAGQVASLLDLLSSFSPSGTDSRVWSLEGSGAFSCKSFFNHLVNERPAESFPLGRSLWKIKAPLKVRAFTWLAGLNRVLTNDLLQIRRPHVCLSPDICLLCWSSGESGKHIFLHCPFSRELWSRLFLLTGERYVGPDSTAAFLEIRFVGFGSSKRGKILWKVAVLAIIWCIWLERNKRIFEGSFATVSSVWDHATHLASLWAHASGAFPGSFTDLSRDWISALM